MNAPKVLKLDESYTFVHYFELSYDIEDVLADLDCRFQRTRLTLPQADCPLSLTDLYEQLDDAIQGLLA